MCAAFLEKMGQFNREKAPERVVHARGMVAKGHFEVGVVGLLPPCILSSLVFFYILSSSLVFFYILSSRQYVLGLACV